MSRPVALLGLLLAACAREPRPASFRPPPTPPASHLSLPFNVTAGAIPCGGSACALGREVCCDNQRCAPLARLTSPLADGVAESCGPPSDEEYFARRAYPVAVVAASCIDSSQCSPGAVCCAARLPSSVRRDLAAPAYPKIQLCTDHPASECTDIEECAGETCRTPWPAVSLPCGGTTCRGRQAECRFDGRPSADRVGPALPPYCARRGDPSRAGGEDQEPCRSPAECPTGAQCIYLAYSIEYSHCAYEHTPIGFGHAAPACASDADCVAVMPRWKRYSPEWLGEIKCRPVRDDPAKRSVCTTAKGELW